MRMIFALFVLASVVGLGNCQYQGQFRGGSSFQNGANFNSGSQRYQQSHVIVPGPGPVLSNNFGGQFKEQRFINIQENIQGMSQGGGGGGGANYGFSSGYQNQLGKYGQSGYGAMSGHGGISGRSGSQVVYDSGLKGAQVDLQLISYTNSDLKLPNSTTCKCPISDCNFIPSNQQNQCQFGFVIVISSADQSIQYVASNFYPAPTNGVMTTGDWTTKHTFYMTTTPVAITIFVQHLGVVISSTGQLLFFNHLTLVDSFDVDLTQSQQTLTGQILSTSMQASLNVDCINNMMGPLCDLNCNGTNSQPNQLVICYSNRTESFSACKWNAYKTQVVDCYVCTHGIYNGTCAAAVVVNNWGVAYAFRTWTIVLGCLLGIALLLILCLILSYIIILNRNSVKERTTYRESYDNSNYASSNTSRKRGTSKSDYAGSDQPLVTNKEFVSTNATRKPAGILRDSQKTRETGHEQSRQINTNQHSSEYTGRRQQDTPDTEESYLANGQIQETTRTTTKTTRREHIV